MNIFGNFLGKNVKFLAIFSQSNGNFPEGQLHTHRGETWTHHSLLFQLSDKLAAGDIGYLGVHVGS